MHLHHHNFNYFVIFFFYLHVVSAGNGGASQAGESPFTAKAALIRYWNRKIPNKLPKPSFLLSKASPLNQLQLASLTKLADQDSLSSHLHAFCSSAHLFCFPDLSPSLGKQNKDFNFAVYSDKNFTNYGTSRIGGVDTFSNYSVDENVASNSFWRYSRDSNVRVDKLSTYSEDSNVPEQRFNMYGSGATGGLGEFKNYARDANVPFLDFTNYETNANGRKQSFKSYSKHANSGYQLFTSYGKNSTGVPTDFSSYAQDTNIFGSNFTSYAESGKRATNTFSSYTIRGSIPLNSFKSYSHGGNGGADKFTSYRDNAHENEFTFQSYAKDSNSQKVDFARYGVDKYGGSQNFKIYGKGSVGHSIGFKTYGELNTFKGYSKKGITFAQYINSTKAKRSSVSESSGKSVDSWVEPGKFFRESELKQGNVMPMPDIRDKMPKRSFLPRSLSSKFPFSTSIVSELKQIFLANENSSMEGILLSTITECEREPSRGETNSCVGSIEDMVDFAVSVLGQNIVVRSTDNVNGSTRDVMIGSVKGVHGGKVTESVSCHQSLFPYLVYYCHSVPKVRVYAAEILDVKSKQRINNGVAICHLDTSAWSPGHGAFVALGSGPGKIEVCHWIFENDMTWTTAD